MIYLNVSMSVCELLILITSLAVIFIFITIVALQTKQTNKQLNI